ncbi:MAG TPA: transposase [Archangium sp.]|uniref:transposase n=1 Tax=Archangium sp. TaxID=1872627 RepID=UPI002E343591|nr:transposase [Archangium sp.]HEX5744918.1 transposase [Archangium sp.]
MAQARLATHQKGARRSGRAIAFVDETGSSFRARVASTWAPVGHPPILRRRDKRREVSSIVALVAPYSPRPARLYSRHQEGGFTSEDIIAALRYFRRKVGRPLTIVWDGLNQPHSAETLDFVARHPKDFRLERLPGYAPDLNPEEGCNGVVKAELRNATPDSVAELRAQALASFMRLGHRHDVLAAFFHHAGLSLTGLP